MSNTRNKSSQSETSTQSNITDYFDTTKPAVLTDKKPALTLKRSRKEFEGAQTLDNFFKPKEFKKRRIALESIASEKAKEPIAPIAITFREDGDGRGALYDHRGVQAATKKPTSVLSESEYNKNFKNEIERFQYVLKFGETFEDTNHKYPPLISAFENKFGLLLLPGVSVKEFTSESYKARKEFEQKLIATARNKGQPILAICGGSWTLYQQYGGTIVEVDDHSYRAGMPRLSPTTGKIGNNKQIHRIAIQPDAAILRASLKLRKGAEPQLPVNSVHSYAPNKMNVPIELEIAALSVQDDELAPISAKTNNLEKEKIKPEPDTVEAFESRHGAPVLAVQWHPEAYTGKSVAEDFCENQQHLISYMAQAGQAFQTKQFMLDDFKTNFSKIKKELHPLELYGFNHSVLKRKHDSVVRFSHFKLNDTHQLRHSDEVKWEIKAKEDFYIERNRN